ncbi:MAG TPA: hypothetical protein VFW87_02420 [Pirellulales bacterium]|nr:hypothetical protein [Pirellulales bacterium]
MNEIPPNQRDVNPYAPPQAPTAPIESEWPGAIDLLYAASIFVLWYVAMCVARWLTDHDAFYVFLVIAGAISMILVAKRYCERNGRLPSNLFKTIIAFEMAALFCVPTYLLAQIWGFSNYPLIEAAAGTIITFLATFTARIRPS